MSGKGIKWGLAALSVCLLAAAFWFFQPVEYEQTEIFGAAPEENWQGYPQTTASLEGIDGRCTLLSSDQNGVVLRWDWRWTKQPRSWATEVAQISWKAKDSQDRPLLIALDEGESYALLQYGAGEAAEILPAPATVLDSMGAVSVVIPAKKGRTAAKGTLFLKIQGSGGTIRQTQFQLRYGKGNPEELSRGINGYLEETGWIQWQTTVFAFANGELKQQS